MCRQILQSRLRPARPPEGDLERGTSNGGRSGRVESYCVHLDATPASPWREVSEEDIDATRRHLFRSDRRGDSLMDGAFPLFGHAPPRKAGSRTSHGERASSWPRSRSSRSSSRSCSSSSCGRIAHSGALPPACRRGEKPAQLFVVTTTRIDLPRHHGLLRPRLPFCRVHGASRSSRTSRTGCGRATWYIGAFNIRTSRSRSWRRGGRHASS